MPSSSQLRDNLQPLFDQYGYEIEQLLITSDSRQGKITIIVDGDHPLDLDHAAQLSRVASSYLDQCSIDSPYILEISSPGIDRPLTTLKHFQRNRGRKIKLICQDGACHEGRILEANQDQLVMIIAQKRDFVLQKIPLAEIIHAIVQVEFSSPSIREIQLLNQHSLTPETETSA